VVAVEARLAAAVEDHMGEVVVRPVAHAGAARANQATSNDRGFTEAVACWPPVPFPSGLSPVPGHRPHFRDWFFSASL
jgi:hypothetical protein